MSDRIFPPSYPEHRKRVHLKGLIEGVLDLALIAGFLAAIGSLITVTIRFGFSL
jgi:hypothetical protein